MADGAASMFGDCRGAGIRVRYVLLDRGFYAVADMAALDGLGVRFVMPVPRSAPVRRAVDEYKARKRKKVSRYTATSNGGETFEVTLVIAERREKSSRRAWTRAGAGPCTWCTRRTCGRKGAPGGQGIPAAYKERCGDRNGLPLRRKDPRQDQEQLRTGAHIPVLLYDDGQQRVGDGEPCSRHREGPPAQEGGTRARSQCRAAASIRSSAVGGGLRAKYDQNVLTAECMLDCWRRFVNEMIKWERRKRGRSSRIPCARSTPNHRQQSGRGTAAATRRQFRPVSRKCAGIAAIRPPAWAILPLISELEAGNAAFVLLTARLNGRPQRPEGGTPTLY